MGPNGSVKPTLLKRLLGLLSPSRGTVHYDTTDLSTMSRREIAKRIALMPQDLNLQFGFTVEQVAAAAEEQVKKAKKQS